MGGEQWTLLGGGFKPSANCQQNENCFLVVEPSEEPCKTTRPFFPNVDSSRFFLEQNNRIFQTLGEVAGSPDPTLTQESVRAMGLDPHGDRLFLLHLLEIYGYDTLLVSEQLCCSWAAADSRPYRPLVLKRGGSFASSWRWVLHYWLPGVRSTVWNFSGIVFLLCIPLFFLCSPWLCPLTAPADVSSPRVMWSNLLDTLPRRLRDGLPTRGWLKRDSVDRIQRQ